MPTTMPVVKKKRGPGKKYVFFGIFPTLEEGLINIEEKHPNNSRLKISRNF